MSLLHKKHVSIIIPTRDAGDGFDQTLRAVYDQEYTGTFEVIIIDSGSIDDTTNIARRYPVKMVNIKPEDFGHGKTRNLGARLAEGRYLVFLTQDAIPSTHKWLSTLIENFEDQDTAGAYGRQIPKEDAKPMEYFFLSSKYPSYRMVKQAKQNKTDMNMIFFSDVNSAMRRQIWEKHQFNDNIIAGEDHEWAKRVLLSGYKITYDPQAAVYHSHNASLKTSFRRYFDLGVSFSQFADDEYSADKLTAKGAAYIIQEMKFLLENGHIKWLPYGMLYNVSKFLGFSLGKQERYLPLSLKRRFSTNNQYWLNRVGKR